MANLSKKHRRSRERPKRPHGSECGICAKPKQYRRNQIQLETRADPAEKTNIKRIEQVSAQCRAIMHLCEAITTVHRDYAAMLDNGAIDATLEIVGARTASFMEILGDMLISMDACSEEDTWLDPVFAEAQRLWPQAETESLDISVGSCRIYLNGEVKEP